MPVEAPAIAEIRCERCGRPIPEGVYWCPSCGKLNASLRVRLVFVLFTVVIIAGFGLTKAYVSYLRNLESSLAQRWFARGEEAMVKGYPSVAIDDYRNALGYDGANRQYRLRLAEALMKEQRRAEARAYLLSLWSQDPADGQLNLALARLYAQENKPDLTIRYYRAAIDGVWSNDPLQHRIDARFELVQYLMQGEDKARATAELIAIQADSPQDPAVSMKVGDLLLRLGENSRAAKSFDAVLTQNAKNIGGLSGAGQAALAMGDYRKAVHLLTTADELTGSKPGTPEADQLAVAREAYDTDPSLRNLTISQRANRVAAAFDLAMNRLRRCASEQNLTLSPESPATVPNAKKSNPVLPNKRNGYITPIVPAAAAPNSLQLLYDSGTQKQPSARTEALRSDPDAMAPTMDFVFEVMRATENTCPPTSMPERALQLIAHHEGEEQR
jgi:tetratricopeptide (TPR) repeat protein